MHGHATSGESLTSTSDYWNNVKSILDTSGELSIMEKELFDVVYEANLKLPNPETVATTIVNETLKLYSAGLLDNLDVPLTYGR